MYRKWLLLRSATNWPTLSEAQTGSSSKRIPWRYVLIVREQAGVVNNESPGTNNRTMISALNILPVPVSVLGTDTYFDSFIYLYICCHCSGSDSSILTTTVQCSSLSTKIPFRTNGFHRCRVRKTPSRTFFLRFFHFIHWYPFFFFSLLILSLSVNEASQFINLQPSTSWSKWVSSLIWYINPYTRLFLYDFNFVLYYSLFI